MNQQTGFRNNAFCLVCLLFCCSLESDACTRVAYKGPDNPVLTRRPMVFSIEIPANQWIFQRGVGSSREVGPNSIEWVSKYGIRKLDSSDNQTYSRELSKGLRRSKPFEFLGL